MGRFFKTGNAFFIDNAVSGAPIELMKTILDKKDTEIDTGIEEAEAAQDELLKLKTLAADNDLAKQVLGGYDKQMTSLTQAMQNDPSNYSSYLREINNIRRKMDIELNNGALAAYSDNLDQKTKFDTAVDAIKGVDNETKATYKDLKYRQYLESGSANYDPVTGTYNHYWKDSDAVNLIEDVTMFDVQEKLKPLLNAQGTSWSTSDVEGNWVRSKGGTYTQMTIEQIEASLGPHDSVEKFRKMREQRFRNDQLLATGIEPSEAEIREEGSKAVQNLIKTTVAQMAYKNQTSSKNTLTANAQASQDAMLEAITKQSDLTNQQVTVFGKKDNELRQFISEQNGTGGDLAKDHTAMVSTFDLISSVGGAKGLLEFNYSSSKLDKKVKDKIEALKEKFKEKYSITGTSDRDIAIMNNALKRLSMEYVAMPLSANNAKTAGFLAKAEAGLMGRIIPQSVHVSVGGFTIYPGGGTRPNASYESLYGDVLNIGGMARYQNNKAGAGTASGVQYRPKTKTVNGQVMVMVNGKAHPTMTLIKYNEQKKLNPNYDAASIGLDVEKIPSSDVSYRPSFVNANARYAKRAYFNGETGKNEVISTTLESEIMDDKVIKLGSTKTGSGGIMEIPLSTVKLIQHYSKNDINKDNQALNHVIEENAKKLTYQLNERFNPKNHISEAEVKALLEMNLDNISGTGTSLANSGEYVVKIEDTNNSAQVTITGTNTPEAMGLK